MLAIMVRTMTELENNVVAAERVQEYVDVESEVSVMCWWQSKYRINVGIGVHGHWVPTAHDVALSQR